MQLEGLVIPVSFDTGMLLKGVGMITDLIEGAVSATFDWAEGMDKLGDVTGMTAEQTAAWAFVTQKAGVSVDTLANSTVILQKGLFDSKGELSTTGKALTDFGIDIMDVNGNVKDQSALMNDIAAKYASFATQTERVDFLTNIFGRSGAQLVDVFDTLAQEGGIDAVEQKVKDLGLAIDPDRYEQFTRNLEELKLAGTGLAIQFTEQLMPILEEILAWAQQFEGMTPEQIFQKMTDIISTLPEKFSAWANSINWEQVSEDLINGINSIDWAALGQWVRQSSIHIADGLIEIFTEVDWAGLFGAIATAFGNFAAGLGGGDLAALKSVWSDNWNQFKEIAIATISITMTYWEGRWNNAKDVVVKSIGLARAVVTSWLQSVPAAINNYFAQAYANLQGWVTKMVETLATLASALAGAGTAGAGGSGAGLSVGGNASGGSASGLTWVGENGPELVNLPQGSYVNHNQQSNRMAQGPVQAYIDYDELARTMARVLGQQMQRA